MVELDEAFEALRTLLDLRDRRKFTDLEFFQGVAKRAPLFRIEAKQSPATFTDDFTFFYKPSDHLKEFLAAMTARDGSLNDKAQLAASEGQGAPLYDLPRGAEILPHGVLAMGRGPGPDDFILVRKSDCIPVESPAAFHARVAHLRGSPDGPPGPH